MKKMFIPTMLLLCTLTLAAAEKPHISLSLDAAQFRASDGGSYLEIYYSLPEKDPAYLLENNLYSCDVLMSLEITQDDTLWANKTWRVTNTMADTALKDGAKQLVDMIRYPVTPGHPYKISLYARDLKESSLDSVHIEFVSQDFSGEGLCISDMLLSNSITPFDSSCAEAFRKWFYCVVPNPEFTFGANSKELYYYFEGYNLDKAVPGSKFRVFVRILDSKGEPFTQTAPVIHERDVRQNTIREIGQLSVSDTPSGVYRLEYTIADSANNALTSKTKVFLVQNPQIKPLSAVFAQDGRAMTFLDDFDIKKLDEEFDKLTAIAKKEDRDIYRSIKEADGKRGFLYSFWNSIKPPEYPLVEDFRIRYMQECQYVNTYYSRPGKPGWRADRGMIWLRYGKPSDIERHTFSKDTKPYEIWRYETIESGVMFVFADRIGYNQFELIHSTKRGELYDPNWQRLLQTSSNEQFQM